ncbi:maltokinase N-terminal cap-like domain-containing protein [Sphaerisporangium fuscum]|uniref:maltokinase N-terminal cap-like domain-containing protein n=1 Tax=Sphaerisporangium fuscum TaxID=2835868 RepID=UPI0027E28D24|nr:phosphotransferase [Sphaerisporangium fuscum]
MRHTLEELLAGWITSQRWFAGKGRAITELTIETITPVPLRGPAESFHSDVAGSSGTTDGTARPSGEHDVTLSHLIITVRQDTQTDRYQLLVGFRPELPQRLRHVAIGETEDGFAYDAVHDAEVTGVLLTSIAEDAELGPLRFRHIPGTRIDTALRSLVLGAEQSNTSLVFGDAYICKLFRKLVPGLNPELEVVCALAERGSPNIARPYGWIETEVAGENTTLAFTQEFLPTASDGWALALTSVRDLYGSLPGMTAADAGGDFAAESHRLGVATAHLHKEMAAAFPTSTIEATEVKRMVEGFRRRLEGAIAEVPQLSEHAKSAYDAFDQLADMGTPVTVQRVHGDYHLGQVMRTPGEWVVLDFEGEPGQPLSERRALDSPLRDVAGMLRSFDYAARHLLADHPQAGSLQRKAAEWAQRNRAAFVAGYSAGGGRIRGVDAVLLRALELSKAAYEVVYESRNRPSWLPIPLAAFTEPEL